VLSKDELYRRVCGCVKSAMDAHPADVQPGSIAKRLVGELHRIILDERAEAGRRAGPGGESRPAESEGPSAPGERGPLDTARSRESLKRA
jgi:hypothetical protein